MNPLVKIFFVIVLITPLNQVFGQAITWQKLFSRDSTFFSDGYSAVQLEDEGYIVIGSDAPNNGFNIMAMRLNKFGNLIWRKFYEGSNPKTIVQANDGNFLIGANVLTKINANGDVIWRRSNAPSFRINLTNDGGFYYCGSVGPGLNTVPSIKKYDSLGFLMWEKIFDKEIHLGGFSNSLINKEGNLVLIGSFSPSDTIYDYPFIMKTDPLGNIIWHREYKYDSLKYFYLTNIVENIEDNYMVSGSNSLCYLVKFDSKGNWIWVRYYKSSFTNLGSFNFLTETRDNGLAFTGVLYMDSTYHVRLLKTDFDGNQEWVRFFGIGQSADANFVKQTKDNGFIITGRRDTFARAQVYVIKTDENGNTSPWVNVKMISDIVPDKFLLYQNYPNPFNPNTKIKFDIWKTGLTEINVYDINGRSIRTLINRSLPEGTYEILFNATDSKQNLSSGIYFYSLYVNGILIETKRMILLK